MTLRFQVVVMTFIYRRLIQRITKNYILYTILFYYLDKLFHFFGTIERRIVIIQMEETLKVNNECVFSELGKEERLSKLANLQKILYSETETLRDTNINLFELIDDLSLLHIDEETDVGNDPKSIRNYRCKDSEISDKFNELRNPILKILIDGSNIVFYAQYFFQFPNL